MRFAPTLVLLAGCWSSSSSPAPAPEPVQNVGPPSPERESIPAHSVWRGKYNCRQGVTQLQLTIDTAPSGGDARALFDFGPHEGNPNIPSGSYRMTGTIREIDLVWQVRLQPLEWISQPENYMMVGINADTDRNHERLEGWITDQGCTKVGLRRVE